MDLAIFLHMLHLTRQQELPLREVSRLGRGHHEFVFYDPGDVVLKLRTEFVNSPVVAGLLHAQRDLKAIMRDKTRNGREHVR